MKVKLCHPDADLNTGIQPFFWSLSPEICIFFKFRFPFFRPSSKSSKMGKSRRTSSSRRAPSTTPWCWPTSGRRAPRRRSWRRVWASATSPSRRFSRPTCSIVPIRLVVFDFHRPWFRRPLLFIFPDSLHIGPVLSIYRVRILNVGDFY